VVFLLIAEAYAQGAAIRELRVHNNALGNGESYEQVARHYYSEGQGSPIHYFSMLCENVKRELLGSIGWIGGLPFSSTCFAANHCLFL
jgi:hypothetical protein